MSYSYVESFLDTSYKNIGLARKIPDRVNWDTGDPYSHLPKKRGNISRVFDLLNVGQHAVAGFAKGIVNDDLNPLAGMTQGIIASNPFGQGREEWKYSFSHVLTDMGWEPESLGGKIAKGAVGMGLDIALDPMTYVTLPLGGLIRGSGKASAEIAVKGNKYLINTTDVGKGIGMSLETAKQVVKNSNLYKSGKMLGDVGQEAADLARQYNKLIGVNSKTAEVSFSLLNAPGGKWLGKKIYGADIPKKVLFTSEQVKTLGDKTIAPMYSAARESIFGSKIGKLFSSKHSIYVASKNKPDEVFNFFKEIDLKKGYAKSKKERAKMYKEISKKYADLSPAENRELIALIEDPKEWYKVEKMIEFSGTKEGAHHMSLIRESKMKEEAMIEQLSHVFDGIDDFDVVKKNLSLTEKELESAYSNLAENILQINTDHVVEMDKYNEFKKIADNANDFLTKTTVKPEDVVKNFKEYSGDVKKRAAETKLQKLHTANFRARAEVNDFTGKIISAEGGTFRDVFIKPKGVSQQYYRGKELELINNGFIEYKKGSERHLETFLDRFKNMDFQVHTTGDGSYIVSHREITKNLDLIERFPAADPRIYDTVARIDKGAVVDNISEYVFGQKGMINHNVWDNKLEEVVSMIEKGRSREEIGNMIFVNKDFYSGKSKQIYEFAAQEIGSYGTGKEYKTWEDYYTKRLDKLSKKIDSHVLSKLDYDEALSRGESKEVIQKLKESITPALDVKDKRLLAQLKADNVKRSSIIHSFKDIESSKEVGEMIRDIKDTEFKTMFNEIVETGRKSMAEDAKDTWLAYRNGQNFSLKQDRLVNGHLVNERDQVMSLFQEKLNWTTAGTPESSSPELLAKLDEKFNKFNHSYSNYISTPIKVDGKLKPLGEVEFSKIGDRSIKFKNASIRDIKNQIDTLGKEGFKAKYKLSDMEVYNLTHYHKQIKEIDLYRKAKNIVSPKEAVALGLEDLTSHQQKALRGYTDIVDELLNDEIKSTFTDLLNHSDARVDELLTRAQKTYNARLLDSGNKHIESLIDQGKKISKPDQLKESIKHTKKIKEIRNLDDISDTRELYHRFYANSTDFMTDLDKELFEVGKKYSSVDEIKKLRAERLIEANNKYRDNISKLKEQAEELKAIKDNMQETFTSTIEEMNKVRGKIDEYESLLNSNEAFELWARSNENIGDRVVTEAMEKVNGHLGEFMLSTEKDYTETVQKVATELKNELYHMGVKEVDIGKLSKAQFDGLMDQYLPHIITDEAKGIIAKDREVQAGLSHFGHKYGFGRQFNPHSISRQITEIELNGKLIKNPNILQINEYFEPMLKGNKMFNESIADIYLTRAMTHNELLFDAEYMEGMFSLLGKEFKGVVEEGYDSVMNYGDLKLFASKSASRHTMLDKSEMISEYLSRPSVQGLIEAEAIKRSRTPQMHGYEFKDIKDIIYSEYVGEFIKKNLTKDVVDELYQNNLRGMLESTGLTESLEDMRLPFSHIDSDKLDVMNKFNASLKERYRDNINKSFRGLTRIKADDMELDEIVNHLNKSLDNLDMTENTIGRFEGLLNKIEGFKDIADPKVGQMQTSIVEKVNQARQLQIIRDNNKFLDMYDKATYFMKLNQTTVLPGFHAKNKFGNTYRSWLDLGVEALDLDMQKGTFNAVRSGGEFAGEAFTSPDGVKYTWDKLYSMAEELGVMSDVAFGGEIGATAAGQGVFRKWVPGKFDPTDTKNFFAYKAGTKVGTFTENQDRLLHFAARIKQGKGAKEAAELSQHFLFDYGDLTFFEQNTMKRIIPFYTWLRKNTSLQLEMLLDNPDKFRNIGKVLGGIESMVDDEDRIDKRWVNDFAKDWVQLPFFVTNPEGRKEPTMLNPNLPMGSLDDIPDLSDLGGTLRNYANRVNPLVKIPLEQMANKHTYFNSPIVRENKTRSENISARLEHVANQFGLYPVAKGFTEKSGVDLGLHTLNAFSGVKAISYDYEKFRPMNIYEAQKKQWREEKVKRKIKSFNKGIVKGYETAVSLAMSAVGMGVDAVADVAYEGRPTRPDEYTEALRPISEQTYHSLSDEEKDKYTPPTNNEVMYFNNRALELEEQALAETGEAKKFIWTLLETTKLGSRNKPYEFGQVNKIIDADTFEVNVGNVPKTVRVLLVDAPEVSKVDIEGNIHGESMPFGEESTQYARDALFEKDVKIYFDGSEEKDKYGRILAYVEVDGVDYTEGLLEAGMAQTGYVIDPPYRRLGTYQKAQEKAVKGKKGIWSIQGYAQPDDEAYFSPIADYPTKSNFQKRKAKELERKRLNYDHSNLLKSINRKLGGY